MKNETTVLLAIVLSFLLFYYCMFRVYRSRTSFERLLHIIAIGSGTMEAHKLLLFGFRNHEVLEFKEINNKIKKELINKYKKGIDEPAYQWLARKKNNNKKGTYELIYKKQNYELVLSGNMMEYRTNDEELFSKIVEEMKSRVEFNAQESYETMHFEKKIFQSGIVEYKSNFFFKNKFKILFDFSKFKQEGLIVFKHIN